VHNIEMQITLSTGSNINTGYIAVDHDQEIIKLLRSLTGEAFP
jgi:hypothetical protein